MTTTQTVDAKVATVMAIYEAFGRGDVPAILAHFADDIRWDEAVRPNALAYLQPRRGKEQVVGFFADLAQNVELTKFEPGAPCVGPAQVIVPIVFAAKNLSTGKQVDEALECHVWTFDAAGKVTAFNHVLDLAPHEAAALP